MGQLVFNGLGVRVGSGSASRLTIAFRPVPLGFGIAIAMRPANWQDGFDLGHDFSAHHRLAGISALGQMRRTARARDWNKMWAAVQAPSNCQTCRMGSQILCEFFERINLSDLIPKIWFGNPWGVFAKISVSKGLGVGDFLGENTVAHGRNGTKATSSSAQACSMPSSGLRDRSNIHFVPRLPVRPHRPAAGMQTIFLKTRYHQFYPWP